MGRGTRIFLGRGNRTDILGCTRADRARNGGIKTVEKGGRKYWEKQLKLGEAV